MAYFQDSRPSREPFLNAPPTVLWLILLFLVAHVVRVLLPGALPNDILENFALTPSHIANAFAGATSAGGVFRVLVPFVSYIFLHADLTHVGVNSLWLLAFGPIVARRLGTRKFLLFFFFCGVMAALVHVAAYWGSPMEVVGASGAVSGLMGGGMRIVYGRFSGRGGALAPVLSKPILAFSAIWMIANVVSGVLRIGVTDDVALVAWVAHLGGYFAGLIAIGVFDRQPLASRSWHSL